MSDTKIQSFSCFDNSKFALKKKPLDYSVLKDKLNKSEDTQSVAKVNKEIEAKKIFYNLFFWVIFRLFKSTVKHIRPLRSTLHDNIVVHYGFIGLELLFIYNIIMGFVLVSKSSEVKALSEQLQKQPVKDDNVAFDIKSFLQLNSRYNNGSSISDTKAVSDPILDITRASQSVAPQHRGSTVSVAAAAAAAASVQSPSYKPPAKYIYKMSK